IFSAVVQRFPQIAQLQQPGGLKEGAANVALAAKQLFTSFTQTLMGQPEELLEALLVQLAQERSQVIVGNLAVDHIQASSAGPFAATEGKAVLAVRNGGADPQFRTLAAMDILRPGWNSVEQRGDAAQQSRFAGFVGRLD